MFSVCLMYFDAVLMIVCCICMMFCDSRISLRVHGGLDDVVPCLVSFCEVVSGPHYVIGICGCCISSMFFSQHASNSRRQS